MISLTNGTGFLTEYAIDAGRVLLFSVDAGLTWSDFPVKGIFAPLLHRCIAYLAATRSNTAPGVVGGNIALSVRLKDTSKRDAYVLDSPAGIEERIVPRVQATSGMALFESGNVSESGVYALRYLPSGRTPGGGELIAAVPVNIDQSESNLRPATAEQLSSFWQTIGVAPRQVRRLLASEKIDTVVLESRFGVELWKHLIGFAIILALAEMAIGREPHSSGQTKRAA